jgi:DNA-binding NarL/FixJ family response regulator
MHAPGQSRWTGNETLTARELQVARFTANRQTNPEVAAERFRSQKTVETHMPNSFRKMHVSSRAPC